MYMTVLESFFFIQLAFVGFINRPSWAGVKVTHTDTHKYTHNGHCLLVWLQG